MSLIVANTSPLIAFARSELLSMLEKLVGSVLVPETVWAECIQDMTKPGATILYAAGEKGLLQCVQDVEIPKALKSANLDAGETAAIALAMKLQSKLLMDEANGRRVAKHHAVQVIGSAGMLLAAKEKGLIAEVAPVLNTWSSFGYRLSAELIAEVLRRAGE